jgi:hypothetical protein
MDLQAVTVSVPREKVADLLRYAASLSEIEDASDRVGDSQFGMKAVKDAYLGGTSEYWRPFLASLAHLSLEAEDSWVRWETLHDQIGLTGRQAAGMLGAAERRLKGAPPYEKKIADGTHWFRMPEAVANLIIKFKQGS